MSKKLINIFKSNYFLLFIGLVLIVISVVLFMSREPASLANPKGEMLDLINGQDWTHQPGSKLINGALEVSALDRKIVNQDGSKGQDNPPINVRGPRLLTHGDFRISLSVRGLQQYRSTLQIYTELPRIYDEWRYETPSARVDIYPGSVNVSIWNGKSDDLATVKSFSCDSTANKDISLDFQGDEILVYASNRMIGSITSDVSYSDKTLWFGTDAGKGSGGWELTKLSAQDLGKNSSVSIIQSPELNTQSTDPNTLKSHSQKHFGTAVSLYPLLSDDKYRNLALSQFSMWTPENEMKAQFIHPQPDIYAFEDADSLVEVASRNNIAIHGHALVFGEANPLWMQNTPSEQLEKVMINHVSTIVGHYKGRVSEWDVVNEPLSEDIDEDTVNPLRQHIWYKAMGESYIAKAFSAAHQADPSAKLYINEYGLEEDGPRWGAMINLLKKLQSQKVPIDGVGFQSHVYERADLVNSPTLKEHMLQLGQMGLLSRISEMDVYGDSSEVQAAQYSSVYKVCIEVQSCQAFSTWGFTDAYGSTTDLHVYPLDFGNDLLWDENFIPKSAVSAITESNQ